MSFALSSMLSDELSCFDIVKVMYGLTDNEVEVLSCIHNLQPVTIKKLGEIIPKDRATITRALQRLMSIGAVSKEKRNLEMGGYHFLYSSMSMNKLKTHLIETLEQIMNHMRDKLENLSEEKCREMFLRVQKKYEKT
ncbi:MAG: MarR family transcriptional regulator [Candidatus Heimdallarchaeaceae archaeon]